MTDATDSQLLRDLLGTPALAPLIRQLDRRLAKRPSLDGHVTLREPSDELREAIQSLLGAPPRRRGKGLRVSLQALDETIRTSGAAAGLVEALCTLLGRPPQHPALENRRRRSAWHQLARRVEDLPAVPPEVSGWLEAICVDGTLRRAARGDLEQAERLLVALARCSAALPLDQPTPLPVFAAQQLGDSHALDLDRPLYRLLLRAVTMRFGASPRTSLRNDRRTWARANVVLDELSSTVLVLNLQSEGPGPVDQLLRSHAAAGLPCRLTFRQLRLAGPTVGPADGEIFVCENPSVVAAAADGLGAGCAPLICTEGQPSHAAFLLLQQLGERGRTLRYHGDFDAAGLRMTAQMIARHGAHPWRMSAADYLDDVSRSRLDFEGPVPRTPWDARLQGVVSEHRKILLEETVLDQLLADLAR